MAPSRVAREGSNGASGVESFPIGDDSWGFAVGANSSYAGEALTVSLTCVNAN